MAATLINSEMERQADRHDEANRCFLLLHESTARLSKVITKLLFVLLIHKCHFLYKTLKNNLIYLASAMDKEFQRTHHNNPLHLLQLTMQNWPGISCH